MRRSAIASQRRSPTWPTSSCPPLRGTGRRLILAARSESLDPAGPRGPEDPPVSPPLPHPAAAPPRGCPVQRAFRDGVRGIRGRPPRAAAEPAARGRARDADAPAPVARADMARAFAGVLQERKGGVEGKR